ncbi:hypothetical protein EON64_20425, partial [archaeon]
EDTELVDMVSVDSFRERHQIPHIDILKIDTEGHGKFCHTIYHTPYIIHLYHAPYAIHHASNSLISLPTLFIPADNKVLLGAVRALSNQSVSMFTFEGGKGVSLSKEMVTQFDAWGFSCYSTSRAGMHDIWVMVYGIW